MLLTEYPAGSQWPAWFREIRRAQDEMNGLFGGLSSAVNDEFPAVNVWVNADGAIVTVQMPGVSSDQVDVTVHQSMVTIRGKCDVEIIDDSAVMRRQERFHGPFGRTIMLPHRVDAEKVSARFERGVLTLELPRPAEDKPHQIKIGHA
jgi:HSP20 family protein